MRLKIVHASSSVKVELTSLHFLSNSFDFLSFPCMGRTLSRVKTELTVGGRSASLILPNSQLLIVSRVRSGDVENRLDSICQ